MSALTLISDPQTATVLLPEFTLIVGIVLLILVPNLGKGTFRLPIPNTNIRLPYLFGGERFAFTSSPRIPGVISVFTLLFSTALALWSQMENPLSESNIWCIATTGEAFSSCAGMIEPSLLKIDGFSRLLEILFYGALISMETGKAVAFAIFNLQARGEMFVTHNDPVYVGMIEIGRAHV